MDICQKGLQYQEGPDRVPIVPMYFCYCSRTISNSCQAQCQNQRYQTKWCRKKINQFADDTVLIIAAEDESLAEVIKVVDHFKQISGLGMNKNKSTIVRLGSIAHSDFKLLSGKDFNWSALSFTSLAINLSAETDEIPDLNYPERIQKITAWLNIWNLKSLSTLGRVLIVKSIAILRLIYQLSMLPTLAQIAWIKSKICCTNLYGTIRETKLKEK